IDKWFSEGRPLLKDFSSYGAYCLRANLLLAIGLTNENIFYPDKNDRKDLEYCYYFPFCEVFSSDDRKHRKLASILLDSDQDFVKGSELSSDLKQLAEEWKKLNE